MCQQLNLITLRRGPHPDRALCYGLNVCSLHRRNVELNVKPRNRFNLGATENRPMTRKMISRTTRFGWLCASFIFLMSSVSTSIAAQDGDGMFTIYLVRHAEKQPDSNDPPLTDCGIERSESFSALFQSVTLEAIYSTDYKRTQSTALPTAMDQGLTIQSYEPDALGKIAEELIRNGQDALVVGHSNTTAVLAGLLVGEEMGSFDESIYNRVYQVVVSKDDRRLHVLHTSFDCSGR